ncbi:MAG: LytTR family transcriptional regulator DNA-binding domain-containing protein [Treponema sp.]|jgi:DNA-binding LytR/AlgR family response regulator|nr:LytTR family transcriptional regulator DNA-binding domain-containing protein [Treponema sp.]
MLLNLEHRKTHKDIEVSIIYPEKNKTVEKLISFINSLSIKIEGYTEDSIKQINVPDIYYIESEDKIAVVFCEKEYYRTKYRLYQISEKLAGLGFVQISKYCLINIDKLDKIIPLSNRRMEAILKNGKQVFITRKYLYDIKKMLQENLDEKR